MVGVWGILFFTDKIALLLIKSLIIPIPMLFVIPVTAGIFDMMFYTKAIAHKQRSAILQTIAVAGEHASYLSEIFNSVFTKHE